MNSKVVEAIKAAKREYYKDWREKNPGKVKQYNQNYWKKKAIKDMVQKEFEDASYSG